MDIAWIGHAAFRLRGRDATLLTDPCPSSTGFRLQRPQADIVTVSNPAPEHAWSDGVAGDPVIITADHQHEFQVPGKQRWLSAPGEYEIKNVLITGVPTPANGAGPNIAFVITIDDLIIAHLGDIRALPPPDHLDTLARADVLLLPVGGHGHMDAPLALDLLAALEPKLIIPMLYKIGPATADLDGVDAFLKSVGATAPPEPDTHLNLTRSALPPHATVHLLAPRGV